MKFIGVSFNMFGYKRIKFDFTKNEIRALKEGRAAFLVIKNTAHFFPPEQVNYYIRDIVLAAQKEPQKDPLYVIDYMESIGFLFNYSHTKYGFIKLYPEMQRATVFIKKHSLQ